jgi:hypothetical protein
MAQGSTKCPFCEEVIIGDAKVCHYCGRNLPSDGGGAPGGAARGAWRTTRTFLVIVVVALLLVVLVFAIRSWLAGFAPPPFAALVNTLLVAS